MENQDYNCVINANIDAKKAVDGINSVSKWWGEDFEGSSQMLGDIFTVRFGETYVTFRVTEMEPEKKIVWLVTECYLPWLENKTEWTATRIVWEITSADNLTRVSMTHVGLTPEIECYTNCEKGWNFYVGESLLKLLTEQKGKPEKIKITTPAN